jgi:signal recognition particle GTPase
MQELIEAAITHALPLMPPATSLAQAVHTALTQMIPASRPLPAAGAAIAVVGAGGSGKSACCAALVDAYREHSTLPATCVTVSPDTALDEPALNAARAGGLLLLDTPTVSSADPGSIDALAELLEQLRPDRVVLALPATLGATPAAQLLEALGPLRADALAITHADETDQLGVAAQTACAFGLAPVYLLARAEHGAWALTLIDPFLLADRLLPLR